MTNQEFVIWLKGMVAGAPKYQPNPEQWARIREELERVDKPVSITFNSGTENTAATTLGIGNLTNITYTTKQQLND